jgi:hypothetical protein
MKHGQARLNYWIDVVTGLGFLASAVSGLVFLIPFDWLSLHNDGIPRVMGLDYQLWSGLHTWTSLIMIVGVAAHLGLHWKWMVKMTRVLLKQIFMESSAIQTDDIISNRIHLIQKS